MVLCQLKRPQRDDPPKMFCYAQERHGCCACCVQCCCERPKQDTQQGVMSSSMCDEGNACFALGFKRLAVVVFPYHSVPKHA